MFPQLKPQIRVLADHNICGNQVKRETLQGRRAFTDEREARLTSFRWLHRYNTVRRHSRLGQQSPITYERSRTTTATLPSAA